MRAVDTNVLVRVLTRDDARQAAIAEKFIAQGAWVSILVLAEAIWVLHSVYACGPQDIVAMVEMLLAHKHLRVQDSDTVGAALELYRSRPALRFTDCLVLQVAKSAGHLPLGTFDRGLAKVEGSEKL
jgi:predicted nucleic-acid-binding protein